MRSTHVQNTKTCVRFGLVRIKKNTLKNSEKIRFKKYMYILRAQRYMFVVGGLLSPQSFILQKLTLKCVTRQCFRGVYL